MNLTKLLATNTLLNYHLVTTPTPLQVSPEAGDSSLAVLTIVVDNLNADGSQPVVYCKQITFHFDIGDPASPDATYLTDIGKGISSSVSPSDQWQPEAGDPGTFVFKPRSDSDGQISAQGLTFTIYGIQVNKLVGAFAFSVSEQASKDNTNYQVRATQFEIAKFPYAFFAGDFSTTTPQVSNDGTAVLNWQGSENAVYTIFWGQNKQDVTKLRSWQTPPLVDTTNFILRVTTQQLDETVALYFCVVVVVAQPTITAMQLTVLKNSVLQGDTRISGILQTDSDVRIARSAQIKANLEVDGKATIRALEVQSTIKAAELASDQMSGKSVKANSFGGNQLDLDGEAAVGSLKARHRAAVAEFLQIGGNAGTGFTPNGNDLSLQINGSSYYSTYNVSGSPNVAFHSTVLIDDKYVPSSTKHEAFLNEYGAICISRSSSRYKNNTQPLADDFHRLLELEPKSFTFKESGEASIGYIAEECDALGLHNLVVYDKDGRPDGIGYRKIPIYLLEIVKDQQNQLRQLQDKVDELQKMIGALVESRR